MKTIIDADLAPELIKTPYIVTQLNLVEDDTTAGNEILLNAQALQERYAELAPFFKQAESASEDIEKEAMSIQAAILRIRLL